MSLLGFLLVLASCGMCFTQSWQVAYQWKQVDFNFDDQQQRLGFVAGNNVPVGLEMWNDKVFVTIPRWKEGVPASLAYFKKSDKNESPKLTPYPDWKSHNVTNPDRIVSPFRLSVDSCDRLWVLDSGKSNILSAAPLSTPPRIFVYDLKTDKLIRSHVLPTTQALDGSLFVNIVTDVVDCDHTYAYLADLLKYGLVVYDFNKDESWRIDNPAFVFDPLATNFNVSGTNFTWEDGIFGLALTAPSGADKYRTLYFHAFSSYDEFKVSTQVLRNKQMKRNDAAFTKVGSRRTNSQSSASVIDTKTGVLFYILINMNAIGCWNYKENQYSPLSQGIVGMDDTTLVFPNDLKMDETGHLWTLTDRMQDFVYNEQGLDLDEVNFRILRGATKDLIKDTECDPKPSSANYNQVSKKLAIVGFVIFLSSYLA